jgi:hypothetical protein
LRFEIVYPVWDGRNASGDALHTYASGVDVASLCAAFGLSAAAGLNAWLPLFGAALAQRLDLVELAQPFDDLSGTGALAVLGVLTVADFVGDKIPAVDHVLHVIGTVVAPASGAALFTGQTGSETDLPTLAAILLGAGTAESIHAGRAAIRPFSTATTGGLGNPVLSVIEDLGSLGLMLAAFVVPVLAVLAAVALVVLILLAWRRRPRPG